MDALESIQTILGKPNIEDNGTAPGDVGKAGRTIGKC
jgi:hypothetical protein